VVLSGGVFNNDLIFNAMMGSLKQGGLSVYTHSRVPAGDGGIALGQAAVAGALSKDLPDFIKNNGQPAQEAVSWD
jgi:hydrogenase maturation protein HypF